MYEVGTGRGDITAFVKGVGMLGYGIYYNTMESVETPLTARAYIFVDPQTQRKVCFVNCEICFITVAIKKGVLKGLDRKYPQFKYDEDNLMMTCQHTHSGPGGYSYYGLYNLSIPGFVAEVYQKIVAGIVEAIAAAESNMQNASLSLASGVFEDDKEVAFNRSVAAYNLNPEVNPKITEANRQTGLDREMTLLKISGENGSDIGSINWFGVHPTSLPNTNHKVCYDNKGYAAAYLEKYYGEKGQSNYLAAFAQGTCGDVTPRFHYHPVYPFQRGQWEGKFVDDFESTKYNGKLQFEKAKEISETAKAMPVEGEIDYELMFVNFSDITANPKFANGNTNAQTGNAALGIGFFKGTRMDGPGMHPIVWGFSLFMTKVVKFVEKFRAKFAREQYKKIIERKYRVHGKKDILVETNTRRILGTKLIDRIFIPGWTDPAIATFKFFYKKVGHLNKPWTPKVLPIQIFIIGNVALAGFSFEITTCAGKRLRKSLEEVLVKRGVNRVILCPYANGYSGYITTYEEYQAQDYEGGHTVFGEWSLAALQTKFDILANEMLKPKAERKFSHDAIPPDFTEEELNHFPFYKRAWYIRQELIRARKMERKGIQVDPS
jgi:neutral ceramidase